MKRGNASFLHKMRYDLRYRLTTAMIVCVVPVGLISCVLFGMLWSRTEREIHASDQARLEQAMAYWERDAYTVDRAMEYFISQYIPELTHNDLSWTDAKRYEMFTALETIVPEAGHNGLTALHDLHAGTLLVQLRDAGVDARTMDSQVAGFTRKIEEGDDMPDNSWQEIDGRFYLLRRFDYHNGSILFALDVGSYILERVEPLREDGTTVYVADGSKILQLTDDGPVETDLTWEDCTASGRGRSALAWSSDRFPIAVSLVNNASVLKRLPQEYWVLFLVVLVCLGAALLLPRLIRLEVLEPTQKLREAMRQLQTGHYDYRLEDTNYRNSGDMQYLFDTFDEMADEIEASREKDEKMHQAEMDNLRLQVNPHMLLNSLNTIYSLAQTRNYEAIQEYSLHLVDYFRYALRRNDDLVTVEQELGFIRTYVDIQKIRYPGLLSFTYTIGEGCEAARIPPLLIQNFVENAMKYALKPGRVTEIFLDIQQEGDRLKVTVTDTGSGIKPEVLERLQAGEVFVDAMGQKHIGVWNCRRRIEVFYNEPARIELTSGPGGTRVILDVPWWTEVRQ